MRLAVSFLDWENGSLKNWRDLPKSQARRSHGLNPLPFEGRVPTFLILPQFSIPCRPLEGSEGKWGHVLHLAHSSLHVSFLGHNGWKRTGRWTRCPFLRYAVSTWFRCPLILVETILHFFFQLGQRGDSGYLEIAGILKSQDANIDTGLLLDTWVSSYLSMNLPTKKWCTWDKYSH